MGETSGSGSCVEEVPSDHHPGVEDDSHDAYSHGVDDDPEEVHYVRGEDRDHFRPVCVQDRGEACDQVHPVCVPGHGEACAQDYQASLPVHVEVFYQDCPVSYHDHEACSCHCPA